MSEHWLDRFWSELKRRKVVRVAVVYAVAAWALVEVASVVFPTLLLPDWTLRLLVILALLGFPIALGLAWAFEVRPEEAPPRVTRDVSGPPAEEPQGEERLDGWKRIAAYLNRDVRTVRRWEKDQGLPVRRLMHQKLATVYAYRSELDAWVRQRDAAPAPAQAATRMRGKPGLRWAWLVIPILVGGILALLFWPAREEPALALGEWDWVLITRFDNRTNESVLDGTVEYALERELANSRYVKVAPRARIDDALGLMKLPPDTPIDRQTGLEISLRDGGIRMLITGRVEKLGNTYLVSSALVNPADGVTLASFSAEAASQDAILPGISSMAREVRAALGEGLERIEASTAMLAKVTTPSLEALHLYSDASQAMSGPERNRAVPILEQAVRIDPEFASAHLLLFYALRDRDQMQRAREHLQLAVELADHTSERERLFILATYYRYLEDTPRTIETYELLTRLYPDHFWANGNLSNMYAWTGRLREAYPYRVRATEMRPNNFWSHLAAAHFALINDERDDAGRFIAEAAALANRPWMTERLDWLPVHAAWIRGEHEQALELLGDAIDELTPAELLANEHLFAQARSLLLAVGKLERFRGLSAMREQVGWLQAVSDRESGHPETLERYLDSGVEGYWDATLAASAGRVEQARALIDDPRAVELVPPPYGIRDWKKLARGQLALAEGRLAEAVELLSTDMLPLNVSARHAYQLAMHGLAQAHEGLDQRDAAIEALESARSQGPLTIFEPGATWFWLHNLHYLHRLHLEAGRSIAAAEVAAELHSALRVADPGHPFLQGLTE